MDEQSVKKQLIQDFFQGFDDTGFWWEDMIKSIREVRGIAVRLENDSACNTIDAIEKQIEESLTICRNAFDEIADKEDFENFSCINAAQVIERFWTELSKIERFWRSDEWAHMMNIVKVFSSADPTQNSTVQDVTKALNNLTL